MLGGPLYETLKKRDGEYPHDNFACLTGSDGGESPTVVHHVGTP
jgi:hypothetical protein